MPNLGNLSKITPIELLAPARDLQVGKVAIDSGADAVYIGAPRFGARQAAGNSMEDIAELCRYAHIFGCKVWVTVNTLLHDDEFADAVEMIRQVYGAGADGILVQDLRLLEYELPPIRLHASTQCDNRTAEQVKRLEDYGFSRVVLARELNPEQIKAIRAATSTELEVFVHGALCVSYSGCCYLSEYATGRSANRGCCAQMCRYKYDLLDKDMNVLAHDKYVLSLRDMDRSAYLKDLLEAGATSFKIEGRLKDANYVRNIVAYYRQLLDSIFEQDPRYCRASKGKIYLDFTPDPEKTFHRGATEYFFPTDSSLANWDTPASTGEYIGRVEAVDHRRNTIDISTEKELHNGDGLTIGNTGFYVNNAAVIRHGSVRIIPSDRQLDGLESKAVYRNYDKQFVDILSRSRTTRKLPVDIVFEDTTEGFRLTIGQYSKEFPCEKTLARNAEQAYENIRCQLSKLGDTPYEAASVDIHMHQAWFIPVSALNRMRRETTAEAASLPEHTDAPESAKHSRVSTTTEENGCYAVSRPPLMTCKYCILREKGICRKQRKPTDKTVEPAFIRSEKHTFALHFDCSKCEMTITEN